jgi:hypothetical protein
MSSLIASFIEMLSDKAPNLVLQDGPRPACKCSPRRLALFPTGTQSRTPGGEGPRPGGRVAPLCQGEGADQDGAACQATRSAHGRYGERSGCGGGHRACKCSPRRSLPFPLPTGTESDLDVAVEIATALVALGEVRSSDPKLEAALTYLEETHSLALKKEDAKAEAPS